MIAVRPKTRGDDVSHSLLFRRPFIIRVNQVLLLLHTLRTPICLHETSLNFLFWKKKWKLATVFRLFGNNKIIINDPPKRLHSIENLRFPLWWQTHFIRSNTRWEPTVWGNEEIRRSSMSKLMQLLILFQLQIWRVRIDRTMEWWASATGTVSISFVLQNAKFISPTCLELRFSLNEYNEMWNWTEIELRHFSEFVSLGIYNSSDVFNMFSHPLKIQIVFIMAKSIVASVFYCYVRVWGFHVGEWRRFREWWCLGTNLSLVRWCLQWANAPNRKKIDTHFIMEGWTMGGTVTNKQ